MGDWRTIVSLVYKARRDPLERPRILWEISCHLSSASSHVDPTRAGLLLPQRTHPGFYNLVESVYSYYRDPNPDSLRRAVWAIAGEAVKPCMPDPRVEEEIARRDKRMKIIGVIMGLLLPALFIASFLANVAVGVLIVVVGAMLWYAIRVEGSRYHRLMVEEAWNKCTLTSRDLWNILSGKPSLPSIFEILGIPEPTLD
ncbi:MAG: hypothetical protein GSR74_03490 [Desulfurococcales archaeon]|nr:hypothetical protein [Desulfurococcales archaeon]